MKNPNAEEYFYLLFYLWSVIVMLKAATFYVLFLSVLFVVVMFEDF